MGEGEGRILRPLIIEWCGLLPPQPSPRLDFAWRGNRPKPPEQLVVSLPNNLSGVVHCTEVSDEMAALIEDEDAAVAPLADIFAENQVDPLPSLPVPRAQASARRAPLPAQGKPAPIPASRRVCLCALPFRACNARGRPPAGREPGR